jgi:hypothetical protein
MKRSYALLTALLLATPAFAQPKSKPKPQMEIAFVIDTTGSMGGLIDSAKKKIWSIVNQIVTAKPQPEIHVGFVAYRDKGDSYITETHDLTSDLDKSFATLSKFEAQGGGDLPEHVNAGLHDAVTKLSWGKNGSGALNYQVIFLVGDCPPHMDYSDGLSYKTDVAKAAQKGILVNTIRCGDNRETEKVWLDIAKRGLGTYLTLPQDGGTISIPTPYDDSMAKLADELESTTVAFRGQEARQTASMRANAAAPAASKAERGAFNAKSAQVYSEFDVTTAVAGGAKANAYKAEQLPPEIAKMPIKERTAYLNKKAAQRKEVQAKMAVLEKKRAAYIMAQFKKRGGTGGFDQKMLQTFKKQAMAKGFKY